MARLIFASITSLDLYVNDARGDFGWAEPDAEVHAFVNDLERPIGTYLYGRRLYETMAVWETLDTSSRAPGMRDYARGVAPTSRLLADPGRGDDAPDAARAHFDPDAVRRLAGAAPTATSRSAGRARRPTRSPPVWSTTCHLFLNPVIVGGGTRPCPTACCSSSSWSTSTASPAASSTSTTAGQS